MKGKDLIEYIKENDAEDHKVFVFTEDDEWLEINSIRIRPTKETIGFGNE